MTTAHLVLASIALLLALLAHGRVGPAVLAILLIVLILRRRK